MQEPRQQSPLHARFQGIDVFRRKRSDLRHYKLSCSSTIESRLYSSATLSLSARQNRLVDLLIAHHYVSPLLDWLLNYFPRAYGPCATAMNHSLTDDTIRNFLLLCSFPFRSCSNGLWMPRLLYSNDVILSSNSAISEFFFSRALNYSSLAYLDYNVHLPDDPASKGRILVSLSVPLTLISYSSTSSWAFVSSFVPLLLMTFR